MTTDELRLRALDHARAHEWAQLLVLAPDLRAGDQSLWVHAWAPVLAIGARTLGRPDARAYLDEAIAAGFFQPELHDPEFTAAFGDDPDWPEVRAAIVANTPPAPVRILAWPTVRPAAPLTLFRLTGEREALLRERTPQPVGSAWQTAVSLLTWVTNAWVHSSFDHMDVPDAVETLDRVAAGARFACKEYTLVLTQALNAHGLPARQVSVLRAGHHAGVGGGHLVSEAWIDDLSRWVLLDGQNGVYWVDEDGDPLGALELQERFLSGGTRPRAVCLRAELDAAELDGWWTYFHSVSVTGVAWGAPAFTPYNEGVVRPTDLLVADVREAYPDLAELACGWAVLDGRPAMLARPAHLFATGWRVTPADGRPVDLALDEAWRVPAAPGGEQTVEVAVLTPYGPLRPATLRYAVPEPTA